MVWFYGGGLVNGSASLPLYRGDRLAEHGVILVTANYRLGALGFLAHPTLSQESQLRLSGNYGLLDQVAALNWIQRNIAAFGGDPGRVTIFGQSSGSISVSALTSSPLAKGLFQRAIGQSGGLFEPLAIVPGYSLAGAQAEGVDFVRRTGAKTIEQLREMPVAELLEVPFDPHLVIDGVALKGSPYDVYANNGQNNVDILVGYNAAEGQYFLHGKSITTENYTQTLSEDFPPILVRLLAPRAGNDNRSARAAAAAFEGDARFRWDMWTWARLAARMGSKHVYLYEFTRAPPFASDSRYFGMGATHGMEMPYVFGNLDSAAAAWTSGDRQLADAMQEYWTNFARTGDPNGAGLPRWPDFRSSLQVMMLGDQIEAKAVPDAESLRRIDRFYRVARAGAEHPLAALSLAIVLVMVFLGGAGFAYRRWRRRPRASEAQAL